MEEEEKNNLFYKEVIDAIRGNDVIKLREIIHNTEFNIDDTIPISYSQSYGITFLGLSIKSVTISDNVILGLDVVKFLLEKGVDVNKKDIAHNTPLILLFKRYDMKNCHRIKLIKLLIAAGADVNVQDSRGKNVLHLTIGNMGLYNTIDLTDLISIFETIEILMEEGMNPNSRDERNDTFFTLLSRRADIEPALQIEFMKRCKDANFNIKGFEGKTVLHNYSFDTYDQYSIESPIETIIYCLKNGADATLVDDEQLLPVNYVHFTDNLYSNNSIIGIILCIASYKAVFNFDWSNLSKHHSCNPNVDSIVLFQKERLNYFMRRIREIFLDPLNEENNSNIDCIFSLIMDFNPDNLEIVLGIEPKELREAFLKIDDNCRDLERTHYVKKSYFSDIIFKILGIRASKALESYKDKLVVDSLIGLIKVVSGQNIVMDFPIKSHESFLSYPDAYNLCLVSKTINMSAYTNISERDICFINKVNSFRKEIDKYQNKSIFSSNSDSNSDSGSNKVIAIATVIGISLSLLSLCIAVIAICITSLYNHPSHSEEITALLIVGILPFAILAFIIIPLNYCFFHVKDLSALVEFPDIQGIDCMQNCLSN